MSWEGSPPVFFMWGDEMLTDEGSVMANRMAKDGVTVIAEHFEVMPHCFALLFGDSAPGKRCFEGWANFCKDVVGGREIRTHGSFLAAMTLEEKSFDVLGLMESLGIDEKKLREKMLARKLKVMKEFEEREARKKSKELEKS